MRITKCDMCKKRIDQKNDKLFLQIGGFGYDSFELCAGCSQPFVKLLTAKKLIKAETARKK